MATLSSSITTPSPTAKFILPGSSCQSTRIILPFESRAFHADRRLHLHAAPRPATHCTAAMATLASAKVLTGESIAFDMRIELAAQVSRMEEIGVVPRLAMIVELDDKDPGGFDYLKEACKSVGIDPYEVLVPGDSSEEQVLKHIRSFNDDLSIHGNSASLLVGSDLRT